MRKRIRIIIGAIVVATMLLVLPTKTHGSFTTIQSNFRDSQGNPLNGRLVLQLPYPAFDTSTSASVGNAPIVFSITNGTLSSAAQVYDVGNLQPANLFYIAKTYDQSGALVFTGNYLITGATYNLSAAIPTNITTNNVSYLAPAQTGGPNTFTGTQTFNGQIVSSVSTGTAPFSIASTTLVPNLNVPTVNGVTVTNTPAGAGLALISTSASAAQWQSTLSGFKVEGVNVSPVTVSNTTSLLPLQTVTIPANDIGVAQTFMIHLAGVWGGTGTPPQMTMTLWLDSVQVSIETPTFAAANNQGWSAEVYFTGVTTGTSGTIIPSNFFWKGTPVAGDTGSSSAGFTGAPVTINTTVSHVLQIQVQWGAANSLNTITSNSMTVYRIG